MSCAKCQSGKDHKINFKPLLFKVWSMDQKQWLYLGAYYKGKAPDLTPDLQSQILDFKKNLRGIYPYITVSKALLYSTKPSTITFGSGRQEQILLI